MKQLSRGFMAYMRIGEEVLGSVVSSDPIARVACIVDLYPDRESSVIKLLLFIKVGQYRAQDIRALRVIYKRL